MAPALVFALPLAEQGHGLARLHPRRPRVDGRLLRLQRGADGHVAMKLRRAAQV